MASLRQIRGRIKAAKNIQQITKAMKMVAAARLRKSQERMLAARPYAQTIAQVLKGLVGSGDMGTHPLLEKRAGAESGKGPLRLVIFSADKGLCGSFNVNILRRATRIIREQQGKREVSLTVVGRKARDFFRHFSVPVASQYTQLGLVQYPVAEAISRECIESFLNGTVDEVILLYTDFKSVISLKPVAVRLLPFDMSQMDLEGEWKAPAGQEQSVFGSAQPADIAYEPSRAAIFDSLAPRAVGMQAWRALLESQASEFAARMTAMDNATRNSKEMIGTLTLLSNRIRQAAVTKEIAELAGAAEALK